jgi:uncharacterized membrane protein
MPLRFAGTIPTALLLTLALLFVVLLVFLYRRTTQSVRRWTKGLMIGIRVVTLLAVIFCLLEPKRPVPAGRDGGPLIPILLDTSLSMAIKDTGRPRVEVLRDVLGRKPFEALEATLSVEYFGYDQRVRRLDNPLGPAIEGNRTDLAEALAFIRDAARRRVVVGAVLFSDGRDTSGGDVSAAAEALRLAGVPVYAVPIGTATELHDVRIDSVTTNKSVSKNATVTVTATVSQSGFKGRTLPVFLMRGSSSILARQMVTFDEGRKTLEFEHTPRGEGVQSYRLFIPPVEGELVEENNEQPFIVNVENRKLKVLYGEGSSVCAQGHWEFEFQYLQAALEEDGDVEVTAMLGFDRDARPDLGVYSVNHPVYGWPRNKKDLFQYDVLIVSDVMLENFTQADLDNMVEFVTEHGGGFVMIGGITSFGRGGWNETVVDKILPVDMEGDLDVDNVEYFKWRVTPEGYTHPIMQIDEDPMKNQMIWDRMTHFYGANRVVRGKPGAIVLAVHPFRQNVYGNHPMCTVQEIGKGRTMAFCPDSTWHWGQDFETRWGEPGLDGTYDNRYYKKFWKNAIRWLAHYRAEIPKRNVTVQSARSSYPVARPVEVAIKVLDDNFKNIPTAEVQASLWRDASKLRDLAVRYSADEEAYVASFEGEREGQYEVRVRAEFNGAPVGEDTMVLSFHRDNVEYRDYRVDRDRLGAIAATTGGRLADLDELGAVVRELGERAKRTDAYVFIDVWDMPAILGAMLALLCAEWIYRRRRGLA